MGLAPYGDPIYVDIILKRLATPKKANKKLDLLFGGPPRRNGEKIGKRHKDLARSVQAAAEIVLMNMVNRLHEETKLENLCMAGEGALNCVANGRILREGPFKRVWIQPAASDAGAALGAALMGWYEYMGKPRMVKPGRDIQKASLLGPSYSDKEIGRYLNENNIQYTKLERGDLLKKVAGFLNAQKIVGWFQGRMEFGPRSLGNRSILADPRSKDMRDIINKNVKLREPFRPFAPSVLFEKAKEHFDLEVKSPYMLFTSQVKSSGFPAITHIDNSARVQTVERRDNPIFHDLLRQFHKNYGCPMVINTSFNVMGEPIVCKPDDAYRCFMMTNIDYLVMGSYLVSKNKD